ncbi:hypothetical protein SAMN03097699_0896 [Flavobacteriaceae bacterium MAR_2010_188]|nr:hypothetical protein SAMN03097699_0896 [Flavobacteriaceae bacterium MAR_2010_188]
MKFNSFIKECSEKEVFKRLSIYVVTSWVLIQVLSVIYEPLALSEKSVSILLIVLLICFPFYIYYIWYSNLAPLENEEEYHTKKGKKKHSEFRNTYFSAMGVIGFLSIASAFYITNNSFASKDLKLTSFESTNKIAILGFGNNTGQKEMDVIGKMATDWITHGITEYNGGQVISPEIVNDYISIIKASTADADNAGVLKQYFQPGKVITGSYFLNGTKLLFRASITDGNIDQTLISFKPIECDQANPLDCIDELKEKILGYFAQTNTEKLKKLSVEDSPPKYKAYEYLLESKASNISDDLEIELINKAIAEDSNYFEPKVLRISFFYNNSEFKKADSLLRSLQPNSFSNNKRQLNLVNHYEALLEGNNRKVYETVMNEFNYTPFDLITNASTLVVAVNFVNQLKGVDSIYSQIEMKEMNLDNCWYCQVRMYMKTLADLGLNRYDNVIDLLEPNIRDVDNINLKKMLIAAYARSDKKKELKDYLSKEEIKIKREELLDLYLFSARQFLLQKDEASADEYLQIINAEKYPESYRSIIAETKFFLKDYEGAKSIFKKELEEHPDNIRIIGWLAAINQLQNNNNRSEELLLKLKSLKAEYQFGTLDYELAKYNAIIGNNTEALDYLLHSIAQGNYYTTNTFNNDPVFVDIKDSPEFQKIMTYWH